MRRPFDLMRHTSLSRDSAQMAEQCAENFRDGNKALGARVVGALKTVSAYSATASTSTQIPVLAAPVPPSAIILVRAQKTRAPSDVVPAVATPNLYYVDGTAGAFEPSGLTLDEQYDLTFLILE